MAFNKFLATEISGLKDPTYASGAASKHYVDANVGGSFTATDYMTSANAINRFYPSSVGHFFTGSGTKLHSSYLSGQRMMDSFNHLLYPTSSSAIARFPNSSTIISRYAPSALTDTRYDQYVGHSGNTTPHITSTERSNWNNILASGNEYTSARKSGQALKIHSFHAIISSQYIKDYIASSVAITRFYDSELDLTTLLNDNYAGSSNINRALLNSISSNLDTRVDSLFNWSSNKSLYANSANVRFRFPASTSIYNRTWVDTFSGSIDGRITALEGASEITWLSLATVSSDAIQGYKHSANAGLHSFNVVNYITSTNAISRFAGSANINRLLVNSISSNLDTRIDSAFGFSSNAINLYYKSSLGHFYTGSGTKLHSTYLSANKVMDLFNHSLYVQSGTKWTDLTDNGETTIHIHDGRYYTETESIANFQNSAQAKSKFYLSSLGHFFTGSGVKLNSAYKSASTGVFAIASHTHAASDVAWSGAYQFTAVSSMVKTLDTWYDVSSEKLTNAYVSTSTGIFAIASHTHSSTDVAWSGAYQFTAVSSLCDLRYDQYVGHSGNTNVHTTAADEAKWNDISASGVKYTKSYNWFVESGVKLSTHENDTTILHTTTAEKAKWNDIAGSGVKYTWAYASMLASGNEIYAAYKHSANAGLHSFNVNNYITSTNAINRFYPSTTGKATSGSLHNLWNWSANKSWYANSSNVRSRFQASSLSYASYAHSTNKSLHDTFTFNMGMVRLSANQNIKLGGFQMASSQNLYVWKANCCDSGGRSQGDLWIQVGSGQCGALNGGKFTNIYKTSSNKIQKGNPLASYGSIATPRGGSNIIVRMMYSGTGVTPGGWAAGQNGRFGTAFCELSTY